MRIEVGDKRFSIEEHEDAVVSALVSHGGVANKADLVSYSGVDHAPTVLKRMLGKEHNAGLLPFFTMPGARDAGGYRTTVNRK